MFSTPHIFLFLYITLPPLNSFLFIIHRFIRSLNFFSMRRNCNLELRLLPSSTSFSSKDFASTQRNRHRDCHQMRELSLSPGVNQQQQLRIFYNERVYVCDVTEFQARAILLLASREMEDRMRTLSSTTPESEPASPSLESQLYSPNNTGLSMKRSLQRFLQKRKYRILTTSPYQY